MSKAKKTKLDPGKQAVEWMESKLVLVGDQCGKPLRLIPEHREIIETLFGNLDEDGNRLIRKCFITMGRKNSKTFLTAAICLYCMIYTKKSHQEIYSCAWSESQAAKVHEYMAVIINRTPFLRERCQINYGKPKTIIYKPKFNTYRAMTSSPAAANGPAPNVMVIDELHVWEGNKAHLLYGALTTGSAAREDFLEIIITTAGHDQSPNNLCFQEYQKAKRWLATPKEQRNPNYAAFVFEVPPEDDIFDERNWKKAMPGIGHWIRMDTIRDLARAAKDSPWNLLTFQQLYMNQWVQSLSSWIDPIKFKEGERDYTEESLHGQVGYFGFDWGLVKDMTSLVGLFPQADGTYKTLTWVWVPEATVEERALNDDPRFKDWVKKGIVRVTPGAATDHETVKRDILEIRDKFFIRLLAGDPFACGETLQWLNRQGVRTHAIQQSSLSIISAGAKYLETLILNDKLHHQAKDEVLTWCMNNATIKVDHYENIRPIKSSDSGRIDPVICLVMAVAVATVIQQQGEISVQ